ncbi:uncharacterized protein LOC132599958 [Lycium barbarum]|uniref:uncharacterized protein LOC132599958 n=1 Tax=Lycium barbarum TaxID=112863 RepID=UPI00293F1E63|nr:uncharacterized protein LOC132599958 [Lycium barbarum]
MMMKCKNNKKQRKRDDHNSKKSNVKVVYISTPMKVKTSATRFRSLVQELTGRDSDIARIMETNGMTEFEDIHHELLPTKSSSPSPSPSPSPSSSLLPAKSSSYSSSVSSESNYFMEPNFNDLFSGQMEEQFLDLLANSSNYLPSSSIDYSAEVDVLGSYDAL